MSEERESLALASSSVRFAFPIISSRERRDVLVYSFWKHFIKDIFLLVINQSYPRFRWFSTLLSLHVYIQQ
jgi:hypothetical protein